MLKNLVKILLLAASLAFWELYVKQLYEWLLNYFGYGGNVYLRFLGYAIPLIVALVLANSITGSGRKE